MVQSPSEVRSPKSELLSSGGSQDLHAGPWEDRGGTLDRARLRADRVGAAGTAAGRSHGVSNFCSNHSSSNIVATASGIIIQPALSWKRRLAVSVPRVWWAIAVTVTRITFISTPIGMALRNRMHALRQRPITDQGDGGRDGEEGHQHAQTVAGLAGLHRSVLHVDDVAFRKSPATARLQAIARWPRSPTAATAPTGRFRSGKAAES